VLILARRVQLIEQAAQCVLSKLVAHHHAIVMFVIDYDVVFSGKRRNECSVRVEIYRSMPELVREVNELREVAPRIIFRMVLFQYITVRCRRQKKETSSGGTVRGNADDALSKLNRQRQDL